MSEESLNHEAKQLKASLSTIDARIDQARNELKGLRAHSDERDIWETNLVMLQVTKQSIFTSCKSLRNLQLSDGICLVQDDFDAHPANQKGHRIVTEGAQQRCTAGFTHW